MTPSCKKKRNVFQVECEFHFKRLAALREVFRHSVILLVGFRSGVEATQRIRRSRQKDKIHFY